MTDFKVLIVTEVRVYKVGSHVYADPSFAKIIERYYNGFGKVVLVSRVLEKTEKRNGYIPIDDYCYEFDNIRSIPGFLVRKIPSKILKHTSEANLVVLRLQSIVSLKMYRLIKKYSRKYMVEVMGCAWDAYWNHGVVGKIIAPLMFLKTRNIIKNANYCVYVTQRFLQKRYPNNNKTIGLSNVDIKAVSQPRKYQGFDKNNFTLMTAAALNVKYKGQQFVIRAISELKKEKDINIKYYLAGKGDGAHLKKIAKKYGVENNVIVLGMLPREKLFDYMRKIDIYIQPSLQEGLPRSLIEAMSSGCVCVGSDVAGIPELLNNEEIFKRRNVDSLKNVLLKITESKDLNSISSRNVRESKKYLASILDKKRREFYKQIKEEGGGIA